MWYLELKIQTQKFTEKLLFSLDGNAGGAGG